MSAYGPIGYYTDCDTAVCEVHFDRSEWEGFEDWDEPLAIFASDESDTPTHCAVCEDLIPHALTPEGYAYVEEYLEHASTHDGRRAIVRQWVEEYLEDEEALERVKDWPLEDEFTPAV